MHDQQWQAHPGASGGGQAELAELPLEAVEGGYLAALHACLLGELRLEPLVVGLSDGYELCRCGDGCLGGLSGQGSWAGACICYALLATWVLHLGEQLQ